MGEWNSNKKVTMTMNDLGCALRDHFRPLSRRMGPQGNTFWLIGAAQVEKVIKTTDGGKTYSFTSIEDVVAAILRHYQRQFSKPDDSDDWEEGVSPSPSR